MLAHNVGILKPGRPDFCGQRKRVRSRFLSYSRRARVDGGVPKAIVGDAVCGLFACFEDGMINLIAHTHLHLLSRIRAPASLASHL